MAKIEVEESDLLANAQVVKAVNMMLANPEARRRVLEAQKIIAPNLPIPELDAPKPYEAKINELQKRFEDAERVRAEEKAAAEAASKTNAFKSKWEESKQQLRQNGYTAEGVAAIEKLAEERGIPDLEAASALFDKLHPPATVAQPNGHTGAWDLFAPPAEEDKNMQKLLESRGDDNMVLNSMINGALAEVRGTARR